MTFSFRPAEPDDRSFIVHAWVSSYQLANAAGLIAMDRWWSVFAPEVERIIDRPTSRTVVAYKRDEPDRIADLQGFITVDTDDEEWSPVVHYCYVKEAFRRAGRARALFEAAGVDPGRPFSYTSTNATVSRLYQARKLPYAKWCPLIARFAIDDPRRPRRSR